VKKWRLEHREVVIKNRVIFYLKIGQKELIGKYCRSCGRALKRKFL
jgi:uncharacterized OB-fold protein